MVSNIKAIALALCIISTVMSMGFFRISQQIGDQDPIVLAGSINQNGLSLGNRSSMFSNLFEENPTPSEFVKRASSRLFDSLGDHSINFGGHPKPDKKTKRAFIKLLLRKTVRRIKSAHDIRRFLDHGEASNYVNLENPCNGVSEPCPWLDLKKKQLGRNVENLNDEIVFIEEILKKKDCPYLRLKLGILKRDVESVNAIIKYIDDHNKLEDDHKDLIELLKTLVDNALANYKDVESFLRDLLQGGVDTLAVIDSEPANADKKCPYLSLQEKIQWREAVNGADKFGFVYWLNHRHSRNRRDCHKLKRRIREAIRRLVRIYKGKRQQRRHRRRHHRRHNRRPRDTAFFRPLGMPLFQKSFNVDSIFNTIRQFESKFGFDDASDKLLKDNGEVTEVA